MLYKERCDQIITCLIFVVHLLNWSLRAKNLVLTAISGGTNIEHLKSSENNLDDFADGFIPKP
jgi:hypothetical protein